MRGLIDAFENLLVSTSMHGGDAAFGAKTLLKTIKWKGPVTPPEKRDAMPVVGHRLAEACERTGTYGSTSASVCQAMLAVQESLHWVKPWGEYLDHADMAALAQNYCFTTLIGPGCPLDADGVYMGLALHGPDLLYPAHAHQADELYWVVGGGGDWKIGIEPWFAVEPGDVMTHDSGMRHAMQTNSMPMLTVWAWWSHINSPILIVRG